MKKIHRFKTAKLIRDKIPDILLDKGVTAHFYQLNQEEYLNSLDNKLMEEAKEVFAAETIQDIREELSDVLEVINAIASARGISFADIEETRLQKKAQKGGFENKIYCEFIEVSSDNKELKSYLANLKEYPEI